MYFFFFNDTATTEIYTLSLHDALPIYLASLGGEPDRIEPVGDGEAAGVVGDAEEAVAPRPSRGGHLGDRRRSEEHTSEFQSRQYLVCRLLLEKKKKYTI